MPRFGEKPSLDTHTKDTRLCQDNLAFVRICCMYERRRKNRTIPTCSVSQQGYIHRTYKVFATFCTQQQKGQERAFVEETAGRLALLSAPLLLLYTLHSYEFSRVRTTPAAASTLAGMYYIDYIYRLDILHGMRKNPTRGRSPADIFKSASNTPSAMRRYTPLAPSAWAWACSPSGIRSRTTP